ncbi:MAG: uncharacterized protein KVP18_000437 [Porospora cf. gigantea A]|uniref:uncharacterized protein n=1 Tax=Porospora cf. gigantea A TaxID=2853593 RepID=UPI00355AACB6|nr:MAG: hypothetical protein KVP18_000437 [Porospora cf. gigantea A]
MDGGCLRCLNADVNAGQNLDDCLCLHAEQNAFLEIGRKHCVGSTLYVTMFPCIGCSKMARQMGVVRLIYSETYDTQTADRIHSFKDAGIVVERVQVGSTVFVATE